MGIKKAAELKQYYYNGSYTNKIVKCEIIGHSKGFNDKSIAVLKIFDQLYKIFVDCLKEMQPTKKEAELIND